MKLGSLFDGIGGFPLSAVRCGIEPVWASEIEPFPILTTYKRFPQMKHLGSVTDINGAEVEPVDILTFGSPCQDLSVAGKQAGIHDGERSNLFFEAVRIIKEMRANDETAGIPAELRRPRFAVWENVPGAFSSNKGADFQAVLQALAEVADPDVSVPLPAKGKWDKAGFILGDGYSIVWRTYDAQFWGVPQRRKRIYLVADFGGQRANEILFDPESVRGDSAQSGEPWQGTAPDAEGSAASDDREGEGAGRGLDAVAFSFDSLASNSMKSKNPHSGCRAVEVVKTLDTTDPNPCKNQGGIAIVAPKLMDAYQHHGWRENEVCGTLTAGQNDSIRGDTPLVVATAEFKEQYLFENHSQDARYKGPLEVSPMLPAHLDTGGNNQPFVVEHEAVVYNGENITSPLNRANPQPGDPCHTLSTDSRNYAVYCLQGNGIDRADTAGCNGKGWKEGTSYTLNTIDRPAVAYSVGNGQLNQISMSEVSNALDCMHDKQAVLYQDTVGALCARDYKGVGSQYVGKDKLVIAPTVQYIVRRLTPLECCRLQGYPDGWTENLAITNPSEEDIAFFMKVWSDWAAINGTKPKTRAQVVKWLADPQSDSAEYKAYGNSLAIPCAYDVISRVAKQGEIK